MELANGYFELTDRPGQGASFPGDSGRREGMGLAVLPVDDRLVRRWQGRIACLCRGALWGFDRLG